ncbi:hypothetical protein HZS_7681 [Henneguya salminicola]|nr:hypothetical protein HZS_7681 [Henneguya salminicola]
MELKSALDILENFKNTDHQHYAHAAYELALVYNMRSMYVDAQRYYAMARDVLDIHITKLKENFIENRQKIDEISIILLQLDDKIEDCRSCIEDSPRINQEKEPKSPTKMTKTDSDITHLVKRKVLYCYLYEIPETDENNQGKKSN